ncbi:MULTISPECIES: PLP-dependent aminotransferase family protein [unclassified Acinetobacter]|uniref:aminotransferase-like domain-containing protein n=1 Tax=unclassified Acinetobacter TaxID=196816 RepID=UPI00293518AD|nr:MULTISPECIES: PLP-dependent aminotransferase family protein [unclassified Acinetobacter]WOE30797.1 PLP-dependent aminotransferase family protein [Acinetobacter sp. SAAs470]WOE38991.1 PLP-dependent aminotransferase family protein [Acinetobacter sp. SAAs474]
MVFQYQKLAAQLSQKIYRGELVVGQRLSSLRNFAQQHQVSLNTAKSCYELLEAQGLIIVKPKIGYFVQRHNVGQIDVPQHHDFASHAREVSNLELQIEIQQASIQTPLIHLGAIQLSPDLMPMQAMRRSLQRALKHSQPEDFLYNHPQGHLRLREALVQHWAEDGLFIASDDIFISNGCIPALAVVIQTLTEQGESIIVPTPHFNGQRQLLATLKRKIVEIPTSHEGFDLCRLEHEMCYSGAKVCLLTANYQNPLGYCLTNIEKQRIAELAQQYQCYVIEDDIFAECYFGSRRPLPIRHWDEAGFVMYCGSVSKSLSPAYRVGWFCISSRLQHLKTKMLNYNITVNTPLQLGLADLIHSRAYREYLAQLQPILLRQVEQYRQYIIQSFYDVELRLTQPQGGYFLWLQFPAVLDSLKMYRYAQSQGINIVPGIVFGEDEKYNNCIRLNTGHALSKKICQAIDTLADWTRMELQHYVKSA